MSATTVRITYETRDILRELAAQENVSMQIILDRAVETYRRKQFLEAANRAFAALKEDKQAWQDEKAERKAWDETLNDGLEDDS